MERRAALIGGFLLLAHLCAGCEAEPAGLTPVHGRVFYKNAPLSGGVIVFTPDPTRTDSGPMSHAEIQADGTYQLRAETGYGAMPGWHRVTVTAFGDERFPARYGDPEQSGLSFEIKPGRTNVIDIHLE